VPDDPDLPPTDDEGFLPSSAPPGWGTETREERLSRLLRKARDLAARPGVYLMKDHKGVVVYVGKAASLPSRVSSYFVPSADLGPKKQPLLEVVHDFEVLECEGEWEALLAENRLIKDISPRFNVRLTDGKTYPYLAVTMKEDFPRVYVTRNLSDPLLKGTPPARVFGPFASAGSLRHAVALLQRVFKYRTCSLDIIENDPKNRHFRPCILASIGRCTAPCADKIGREAYRADIDRFTRFLTSKRSAMLREMREDMQRASAAQEFETAAAIRDQVRAIEKLDERARSSTGSMQEGWQPEVEVHFADPRKGLRALQRVLEKAGAWEAGEPDDATKQGEAKTDAPPTPFPLPLGGGSEEVSDAEETEPRQGDATPAPHPSGAPASSARTIRCIEAIDIAHLQGGETVGSKVCFVDGKPLKSEYRRYRIKRGIKASGHHGIESSSHGAMMPRASMPSANDDYASIREVVSRRYREAGAGNELYPDVILIDGGLGQLHAALEAFEQLPVKPPLVISLAKKEELIYVQARKEPIRLGRENPALKLCQAIRDEAHRFAQHYHHVLRRKKTLGEE
jgi:excinuclease UvrABC nuclease subunit